MATIDYGKNSLEVDDRTADVLRALIRSIVNAGAFEWLALPVATGEAEGSVDLLVGPGIPIAISTDTRIGTNERLDSLLAKYLPDDRIEDVTDQ